MTETHIYHFFADVITDGEVSATVDGVLRGNIVDVEGYLELKEKIKKEFGYTHKESIRIRTLNKL